MIPSARAAIPAIASPRTRSRAPSRVVVGALVVVAAIGYLVFGSLQSTTVYYITVSELQARGPAAYGQHVRVHGKVVAGTITRDAATNSLRFTVADAADDGGSMPVAYRGVVPDIFNDQAEVVVEGKYTEPGIFQATTLLAKCPSRFEGE
ncbi:MAG: cytochrome c maturation protein CcmE [Chloroflexi bacterium]|nr:cytochrome c maturation protein CcmE [Chloroflexota bacterium]